MFVVVFNNLLQNSNTSAYKLSKETGIPQSLIHCYKKGTKSPSSSNLLKIATFFGCSTDSLLGLEEGTKKEPSSQKEQELSDSEAAWMDKLDRLNADQLKQLDAFIQFLLSQNQSDDQ